MEPFRNLRSRIIAIPVDDIDTDQIIPARFLKTTDKLGLGAHLFADWRYQKDGTPNPDFVLNQEVMAGREILLAGNNFGCGSSREHAPWALTAWGFRVIVSTSFADIFANNALKNGLLLVTIDQELHRQWLASAVAAPEEEVKVNLESQTLSRQGHPTVPFPIDSFSKRCLLQGLDQLSYIQSFKSEILQFEEKRV